jgi:hypothetical protein
MSMTAAVPSPAHIAASTATLDAGTNGLPEHSVEVLAEHPDGAKRDKRDQRCEQSVLEQVLSVIQPNPSLE